MTPGEGRVTLSADAGSIGYAGVKVYDSGSEAIPRQTVRVTLPAGRSLQFAAEGGRYALNVVNGSGNVVSYAGDLSSDWQSLSVPNVDLGFPGSGSVAMMWVAVRAAASALMVDSTSLQFFVGDESVITSSSSPITVVR